MAATLLDGNTNNNMKKVTLQNYRKDQHYPSVAKAISEILKTNNFVAPVEVLLQMQRSTKQQLEDWRFGRIAYLERVTIGGLGKMYRILRIIELQARSLNLKPSQTVYRKRDKGGKRIVLRFSKSGDPNLEAAYSRHFVSTNKATANPVDQNSDVETKGMDAGQNESGNCPGPKMALDRSANLVSCQGMELEGSFAQGGTDMARNEVRRQKKLEARKAKRKEQKRAVARFQSAGMQARMAVAKDWPVMDARVTNSLWDTGIGYVALARRGRNRQVAAAIFLVDVYCLGVKDVLAFVDHEARWRDFVREAAERCQGWTEVPPEHARKLVEGSVAYARSFELQPHRDWPTAAILFGDIDASQCLTEFTFGRDGKPFFLGGPNDSPQRVQQILETLARTAGPENFRFVAPIEGHLMSTELVERLEREIVNVAEPEQDNLIEHEPELRHGGA